MLNIKCKCYMLNLNLNLKSKCLMLNPNVIGRTKYFANLQIYTAFTLPK